MKAPLDAGAPFVAALALSLLLGRPLIALLRRISFRQQAYEDAPKTHAAKTGTPTMGGLLFLVALVTAAAWKPDPAAIALVVLGLHLDQARAQPRFACARQARADARGRGRLPRARTARFEPNAARRRSHLRGCDAARSALAVVRARPARDPRDDARGESHRRSRRSCGRLGPPTAPGDGQGKGSILPDCAAFAKSHGSSWGTPARWRWEACSPAARS